MDYQSNTEYVFIPFSYNDERVFLPLVRKVEDSGLWDPVQDKFAYLLKYVANKMDSNNRENCQCFHFILKDSSRERCGLGGAEDWFLTERKHSFGGNKERIRFQIMGTQLFCFSSTVGILAFQLRMERDDPFWISHALYHLKKVSRAYVFQESLGGEARTTLTEMAGRILKEYETASPVELFYFADPIQARANVLTFLEVHSQEDYRKELFYLRHCYGERFPYFEDRKAEEKEIANYTTNVTWGVTSEALVALACPDNGQEDFVRKRFYNNFNTEYLFMYVLLLHQKFVLYLFLTRIDMKTCDNLESLEKYRRELYAFETNFVFSRVTEVPQYRDLYDKVVEAFALDKMYQDVREPLVSLRELRREAVEKERDKREDKVNKALLLLSILSVFSALTDSYHAAEEICGLLHVDNAVRAVQVVVILAIFVVGFFVLKNLVGNKKENSEE
ncbi:MAG: hypothetical protein J5493_08460 [Lachnospiraceae bacterium]|nr:hypothetical protein [Lachnospiraceae bacterium]